jgi:hypothetical protein
MRSKLKTLFILIFAPLCFSFNAHAQLEKLYASYGCRYYERIFLEEPVADTLSLVTEEVLIGDESIDAATEAIADMEASWKQWRTVENYSYGKDRGSMDMIVELNALHPYFRDKIVRLINNCKAQGVELAVVESYRTHAKQNEYKTMGKKYTRSGAGKSKHQYGLAVDLVPVVDSVAIWDNIALWKKVGVAGEKLGLRWGGRWKKPYDPGHFEWTGGITTAELAMGKLPLVPNKDTHYPCIEEDIKLLRQYWKEWELSQSSMARK